MESIYAKALYKSQFAKLTVQGSKRKKIVKISLIISFLFIGFVGYGIHWSFFDMSRLPTQGNILRKKHLLMVRIL